MNRYVAVTIGAVGALFALTILLGSWYTIDQRERGVILRNGAISGIAGPGLGFKLPLVDSVVKIDTSNRTVRWNGEQALEAYSRDLQPADIAATVTYSVDPSKADRVYADFGGTDGLEARLLNRVVTQELKTVFGRYTATSAIAERNAMNAAIKATIISALPADAPFIVENITIEDIKFSKSFEESINQRMLAEVEVQRIRQNAEREKVNAEIAVTQAKGRADSALAEAEAAAKAITLRGDAEARAIKARGDALRENPGLVALTQAERWDGKLPVTMVPGGSVPMIALSK